MQPANYVEAEIRNNHLVFRDNSCWSEVLSTGIFYLKIPIDLDCSAGVNFCNLFHLKPKEGKGDKYKGFKYKTIHKSVLGYSDTGKDQVEKFQLEYHLWKQNLPVELVSMLFRFNELAKIVVYDFFARCNVNSAHISQITGGIDTDEALQYCIFNNFVSDKIALDGFTPHKDSGFIQLMYIDESGLEIWINETWVPLEPRPGYLVAIMGHSLEVLTERMLVKAKAAYHRVRSIKRRSNQKERTSFGVYIGPKFEQNLYQYDERGKLLVFKPFMSFQREKAAEMGYEFHPAFETVS